LTDANFSSCSIKIQTKREEEEEEEEEIKNPLKKGKECNNSIEERL
jgi:hypothetical protein